MARRGNSLLIVEDDSIYYMLHGDVTYTDEALKRNELSVVFEDKEAARKTLDRVREFVQNNDTIYLSTHTLEALISLEKKSIIHI